MKTNSSKRNRSKDVAWINDFIKTHRDDADTPMLKVMQLLRNSMDQIKELEPYFDFAVNEECWKYDECDTMEPFIKANKAVLNAEYSGDESLCPKTIEIGLSTIIKGLDLDSSGIFC